MAVDSVDGSGAALFAAQPDALLHADLSLCLAGGLFRLAGLGALILRDLTLGDLNGALSLRWD